MSSAETPHPGDSSPAAGGARGVELARQALAQARVAAKERGATPGPRPRRARSRSARSRNEPQHFGDAIRAWLIEHGWQEQVAIGGIFGRWSQIVGERLAQYARPATFDDGVLTVDTDSPTWATQVRALTPQLLRRINEELGHGSVTSIKVRGPQRSSRSTGAWRAR
ncbi:DciA family protein [Salinactinospora qingdaonensis]|uniref:DUF721 domain-containing protein n=1 Tax=Salinactinospora qingdaonensis TaxID=702744 RepID=A0ABP7F7Q5_9ACTN